MKNFGTARIAYFIAVFCVITTVAAYGQTFTTLVSFDIADGAWPYTTSLIEGSNGKLFGTTSKGGTHDDGTVFEITATGKVTTLYSFCSLANCADGDDPQGALLQTASGAAYGTTYAGGANHGGTVFRIAAPGELSTLYSFCSLPNCADGEEVTAGLVQGSNGSVYGTTTLGGGASNAGTIFEITQAGKLTTLHSFCSQTSCPDGSVPNGLILASNGNLYGTTQYGGVSNAGTIFEMTPSGKLTTLYSFCSHTNCTDGNEPDAALLEGSNGELYGVTMAGGANNRGVVFEFTSAGELNTVYSFCSLLDCSDGAVPQAALIQATDGNFYGTTLGGGGNESFSGTIFRLTPAGELTTLYSFCSQAHCADGADPYAGLLQASNGVFYGTAYHGGSSTKCSLRCGTVYSLSLDLGSPLQASPGYGEIGRSLDKQR
jgi:uncharacterized repeat protein (TIGR03803 family)